MRNPFTLPIGYGSPKKITAFYFVERYPFVVESGVTEKDVRTSLKEVKVLVDKLRKAIPKP